jgi:hypothetical protein
MMMRASLAGDGQFVGRLNRFGDRRFQGSENNGGGLLDHLKAFRQQEALP